jgi:glycosyltransferase involved in cell wall biosynthesis
VAMWRVLTDDQLRASLIEKGLRRAQTFSLERAAQQTLEVYHRVAG